MSSAYEIAKSARVAGNILKTLSNESRSAILYKIHDSLAASKDTIKAANEKDLAAAETSNLSSALLKRLNLFQGDKFETMLQGIKDVADLQDPVGQVKLARQLDDDMMLYQVTAPVGVLLVIFESRPEVIANITALCIKSGNAGILKGGKESVNTFREMAQVINDTIAKNVAATGVPLGAVQLIETRQDVSDLLDQDELIDLVVPRGSNALVRNIKRNTKIPVLGHADGICSVYVDEFADLEKAKRISVDAKTNYPAGCNAMETLLINPKLSHWEDVLTNMIENGVTLHVTSDVRDSYTKQIGDKLTDDIKSHIVDVNEKEDFDKEFISLDCAVKFIKDTQGAIEHINEHSSRHTDSIITENKENADKFLKGIDSAGVYWNASTRFADGFRYGFGAEVGISTSKIHARGPVGLDGLVTYQYQIRGNGNIAADYLGAGGNRAFVHKDLDPTKVFL
ncbi:similar to Saccharomyces cerevisiae YOR323C PRO2 Gamma-glutamyl phosphate reductase, catalyzes the second step in proline biosynthesis [Maudiozyma barnettii]|uniref:glutamate-5-semialdehyde dehydrogenase n=1 Tax=Maudiozyma barnettii TaxID=61262 RepID=A0A8H2VEJ5_9SACH|nr:glutamate-5-semialdehyde dehydrogenase [Kazachstania barnettii]CAB4254120.1 similar to Saccharomyces cerevisiae YOR323C PRO2 Gamma-glutamyl phosphate reductase, catalyzes the second step in proline biosynthesis [Kazachstania barnettii]CAD1781870.1 similar to Saccharomyces cerevisiae YOR323C PRO2 Gamma-glutamyl phosphate reductase, catalyzes the second step in proline biosynthesis [Kazachstania barnettii]